MRQAFEIAGLQVRPGERGAGWIQIAKTAAGSPIALPIVVFHGKADGPVLAIDAAAHGDEYEGVLSLISMLRQLDPITIRGTLVAVPILNGPSFDAEVRGNPLERHFYDLNRSFPGEANGTITQRIAAAYVSEVVKRASAVVSLHGGGNVFYLDGFVIAHSTGGSALELIKAWGWKRFTDNPDVGVNRHQGTMHEKAAELGIPSITVEMGGGSHRSPEHLRRTKAEFMRGLRNIMIHFGLLEGQPERPKTLWKIRKQNSRLNDGGIMDLDDGIDIESQVAKGQRIITVYDAHGAVVEEVRAPFAGRVMGLPASPLGYPGRIVTSVYEVIEEVRV